ncbi:hypothetical protein NW754_009976 [Fusarium falciforme]|uniref:N-acetyltransferase domain-containing protein n=1 Tax=Fusarium falciforme TaxID=195108 RepID=A0A9W8V2L6_9HYPO|nr:hypothetical protein NW754_009976 [Fusarium falciforme]KAJ4190747.1 hypothetical protein NW755_004961 [Fusarium falciforme]KAJ4257211.1 hypothetical protein NW757_003832 [Fusarium falciforme]
MGSEPRNMVAPKRSASPLESAVLKSTKKPSSRNSDSTAGAIGAPADVPVRIIVSLRSDSKAKWNDPEPNTYLDPSTIPGNEDAEIDAETKELSDMSGLPFPDDFADLRWLERIDGLAFVKGNRIGYCDAKLIRRLQIHHKFWVAMEEPTRQTSELAFELFDRYGRLCKEFREHPVHRGTGVWGSELDGGDIILFESIRIEPGHRHQKIGTKIVNAVLNKARRKSTKFFALAKPRCLVEEIDFENTEQRVVATEAAEQFFRSIGFRRVGTSGWFAFTDDSRHPSTHLENSDDWNQSRFSQVPQPTVETFSRLGGPDMVDSECVRLLQTDLRLQLEDNPGVLLDETENTILHLLALRTWPKSIAYAIDEWPQLKSVRNREGHTPLEALQTLMETSRTTRTENGKTYVVSDDFRGFSSLQVASLGALEGVTVCDLDKVPKDVIARVFTTPKQEFQRIPGASEIQWTLRLKYGCTCGQCLGGFLSPRMQQALRQQSGLQLGALWDQIDDGPAWLKWNRTELRRVSFTTQDLMENHKNLRVGFVTLSKHFSTCIEQKRVPDEANILEVSQGSGEWPPVTQLYLRCGGTISAAVTMIFHKVKDRSSWATCSSNRRTFWAPWAQPDPMPGIVECRNDLEFGFVTGMCGYEGSEV